MSGCFRSTSIVCPSASSRTRIQARPEATTTAKETPMSEPGIRISNVLLTFSPADLLPFPFRWHPCLQATSNLASSAALNHICILRYQSETARDQLCDSICNSSAKQCPVESRAARFLMGIRSLPSPPAPSTPAVRAAMRGNQRRDTRPELALRSALHARGIRFRVDFPIRPADGVRPIRPDIVFSRAKLAVFVDGCFWHGCPEHGTQPSRNSAYWTAKLERNVERDHRHDALLDEAGWTVVRVWEHEAWHDIAVERIEHHLATIR
jgi:DNA mismatch endonuclease (patch repair protein)